MQSRRACDSPEHCCLHKMARRETPAQKGTAPPCPAGTAPGARPLSPPIQVCACPVSSPGPQNRNTAAASKPPPGLLPGAHGGRLPSLGPSPARTYLLLRAPSEAVRGCAGPRAATSCGGAGSRGGPARIPPRAASRRRDGGRAPGCPRSPGGGEGKRGKSDPSAGSFPRPSLGCGSSLLPTVNAEAASAPAPHPPPPSPLSVQTQRKAPVLPSAASERRSTSLV